MYSACLVYIYVGVNAPCDFFRLKPVKDFDMVSCGSSGYAQEREYCLSVEVSEVTWCLVSWRALRRNDDSANHLSIEVQVPPHLRFRTTTSFY